MLSSIKSTVGIKFPKKKFFFFISAENRLGAEGMKQISNIYRLKGIYFLPLHDGETMLFVMVFAFRNFLIQDSKILHVG